MANKGFLRTVFHSKLGRPILKKLISYRNNFLEFNDMSRKKFIESQGATCDNWTWSWSFINEQQQVIVFGLWDLERGEKPVIFSDNWQFDDKGKKKSAYNQSREHIRLIEEEGYSLKTFPIIYSDRRKKHGKGPAAIKDFIPKLTEMSLHRGNGNWCAYPKSDSCLSLPEELEAPELFIEGAVERISINRYERNPHARKKCLEHHGYSCTVCDFDFEVTYGTIGKQYIHVHHQVPLSQISKEYQCDPITDLIPICPNCHCILHKYSPPLTVNELKTIMGRG